MIEIENKENCSGCHACANACPVNCINMTCDKEGFLYPVIDKDKCIGCNKCELVCHSINPLQNDNIPSAYACMNIDEVTRMHSSSGGIFTLLAECIIEQGGVVFGAAFDADYNVHHIAATDLEQLSQIRGSKYVQSKIGDTYIQAKNFLEQDIPVLFSGTPCQIDGLLKYLCGKHYEKLYTQDIVCHGAPSPKVWEEYLKHVKNISGNNIKYIYFRNKNNGWKNFGVKIEFENNKSDIKDFKKDYFMKGFLSNLYLRPSCYNCHSKSLNRNSDITLADFWGIDNILPDMNDDKGTSMLLVNTKKGKTLFDNISEKIKFQSVDCSDAVKYNSSALKSVDKPKSRNKVIKQINSKNFEKIIKKYTSPSFIRKCIIKARIIIKQIINK